jgi:N-acetyl sugar amidotransferase
MNENSQLASSYYQACARCIMDTVADRNIFFNKLGICNHCQRYDEMFSTRVVGGAPGKDFTEELVKKIKNAGRGLDYDCIIGISGGVDSTYVAWLVKKLGLRPLAIHLDNGWNSELAVKNIERILRKLEIDLHTCVLNWEEFRELQIAFLKASTPDGEIPSDHAISSVLWREAVKRGVKYIISGMNFTTESVSVPNWSYGHSDWRYIKSVNKLFGSVKLRTYPHFSLLYLMYVNLFRRIRIVSILNYIDYNKKEAMELLTNELDWEYYGGKHYESIYTRFYQGYLLPKKFGIDKRYGHLSDLINSGQISRSQAIDEIKKPTYPEDLQMQDLLYALKKLRLRPDDFDRIMQLPVKSFRDYKNSYALVNFLKLLVNFLRKYGFYPR